MAVNTSSGLPFFLDLEPDEALDWGDEFAAITKHKPGENP